MTDLARLGFSANTADLKKAKADLDALVPSAQKAEKATDKFNRAAAGVTTGTRGAAAGIKSFDVAVMGATGTTDRLSKVALSTGTAMGTVHRAAIGASSGLKIMDAGVLDLNSDAAVLRGQMAMLESQLTTIAPASAKATSALNRMGAAANDNINAMQATPGNIAAQFQDIGVTAAAGMNPMLIALQQGTQLSSALSGGIGNLMAGFGQLFSVTTILTVGLVGLAAAGLQNVDWMKVAEVSLNLLADGLEYVADFAATFGTALLFAFSPLILKSIAVMTFSIGVGLVKALWGATAALVAFALANPFNFIIVAIGAVVTAMYGLHKAFGGVFSDIIGWIKDTANTFVGLFVAAYRTVVRVWEQLPKVLDGAYNKAKQGANDLFKLKNTDTGEVTTLFNFDVDKKNFSAVDRTMAILSEERGRVQGQDWIGGFADGIRSGASKLRDFAGGLTNGEDGSEKTDKAASEVDKIAESYKELIDATNRRITALNVERAALGMSENAARLYRNEQDLIAQAMQKNIPLTDKVRDTLSELAATLTDAEIGKEIAEMTKSFKDQHQSLKDQAELIGLSGLELSYNEHYQNLVNDAVKRGIIDTEKMTDVMREYVSVLSEQAMILARTSEFNRQTEFVAGLTKAHKEHMFTLQRERGEIGLTGVALEAYRLETEALNSAMQQQIPLTDEIIDGIKRQSVEQAVTTEAIRKQREEIEFYKGTYRGFFDDMIQGLRNGQSVWETFGNAVMSVVNKIIDRLLDMDGGVLDKLVGLGGSLFGMGSPQSGLLGDVTNTMAANPGLFADGGAFGSSGQLTHFAKGGAFTNGVYDTPTLFRFAKGGAIGEMGEAGPEAVMPLKRGPDGSLGVQMHGPQTINVQIGVNDDRFNAYVDERADAQISASAPSIASAGSQIAESRMAVMRRRSIG